MKFRILGLALGAGLTAAQAPQSPAPARATAPAPTLGQRSAFSWGDYDADGLLDALVLPPGASARLLHNAGDGSFVDEGARRGLAELGELSTACFGDYDGDGRLDLYVGRSEGQGGLLRQNETGLFVDAILGSGLEAAVAARQARWLDYDGDGDLDLHWIGVEAELLYRNLGRDGGWRFERVELGLPGTGWELAAGRPMDVSAEQARATDRPEDSARPIGSASQGGLAAPSGSAAASSGSTASASTSAPGFEGICAASIIDQATGACLEASSVPTLGYLYPLGPELNISANGKVGIGVVSSGPKLEVDLATNEQVRFGRVGTTSEVQLTHGRLRSDAGRFQILGQSLNDVPRPISFGQADGDYDVTIDTNGRVGIGTSTPSVALDVVGNVNASGTGTFGGAVTGQRLISTTTTAAPFTVSSAIKVANLNADLFDGFDSSEFSRFGTAVDTNEIANGAVTSPKLGSFLSLTGDLTVDGSTLFVDSLNNRVGIGTLTPTVRLEVSGDETITGDLTVDDTVTIGNSVTAEGGLVTMTNSAAGGGIVSTYSPSGDVNCRLTHLSNSPSNGYVAVYDDAGALQAGIYVDAAGNGIVFGDVKNFVADNPLDPSTKIWYASLEGPEAAAYVRGTGELVDGQATIQLPEHFQSVSSSNGITVLVSANGPESRGLAVVEKARDHFVVRELFAGHGSYSFDWEVKAVRRGFEDYQVLRPADYAQPATPEAIVPDLEQDD